MGRPPSNGGPSFRFNPNEVTEMEGILRAHNCLVPQREILVALAEKFSNSAERSGRPPVQMKQVWNWFQNRRYALRAKSAKPPVKLNVSPMPQHDSAAPRNVSQAPQHPSVPAANVRNVPQVSQPVPTPTENLLRFDAVLETSLIQIVHSVGRNGTDNSQMEFEAKSARDGAWYDVATFLSHRSLETNDPEVLVRFAGFGPEEDEWVNVRKHVRQRSLPCESSECVAVLPGDLILCFQEGKEQALYFDAHVLDAQRRRHDVRGCRCRFLVRYDHDQSEEIVPLRKVCRRPETDYRMQQLHADSADMKQNKTGPEPYNGNNVKAYPPAEVTSEQPKVDGPAETIPKPANAEMPADSRPHSVPASHANVSLTTSVGPTAHSSETSASATTSSPLSNVSLPPTLNPDPNSRVPETTTLAPVVSSVSVMPTVAPIASSSDPGATIVAPVASSVPVMPPAAPTANSNVPGATIVAPISSSVPVAPTVAPVASSISVAPTVAPVANSSDPGATIVAPVADPSVPGATFVAPTASNVHAAPAGASVADSNVSLVPTTPPAASSSVPIAPTASVAANSRVPGATIVDPIASNVHVSPATTPVANSSAPIIPTTAPADDASVPEPETPLPTANSCAPTAPNVASTANSSVPSSPSTSPDTNSSVPMAPTANSSAQVAPDVARAANPSAPTASSAEAPVANSSASVAMPTEALVVTNSSVSGTSTGVSVDPNVLPVTEFNDLTEKVLESGSSDNVDNANSESANHSTAGRSDTSVAVSEERPGESMQLG